MRTRLILDTHALLWTLLEPDRIPDRTLGQIRDPVTELLVSAASAWEIGTKFRLGKLDEAQAVVHGYAPMVNVPTLRRRRESGATRTPSMGRGVQPGHTGGRARRTRSPGRATVRSITAREAGGR